MKKQKPPPPPARKSPAPSPAPKLKKSAGRPRTHDREALMRVICGHLCAGVSLDTAARKADPLLHPSTVLTWVEKDPQGIGQEYARARKVGYELMGDRITQVAAETHAMATVHATDSFNTPLFNADGSPVLKDVVMTLSSEVIAHKRLVVDTMKWQLSKMLPKVYGDKVVQEVTGKDGGPISTVNQTVYLHGLSDIELEQMNALLAKAVPPPAKE